jgi:long-chain acyl-CoA synthetase
MLSLVRPALVVCAPPRLDPDIESPQSQDIVVDRDPDALFLIMFSSGTTGKPKGICHRLNSVVGSASSFAKLSGMGCDTRLYHVLPMAYMAGFLNTMLAPLVAGGCIVQGPLFSPKVGLDFWRRPLQADVNTLSLIPSIAITLCRLTRDLDVARRVVDRSSTIQCTSQSIASALRRQFLAKFGEPLQDCYGVTELGGPLSVQSRDDAYGEDNAGRLLPELELDLRPAPQGENELWLRSPFMMMGYLEETGISPAASDDGFLSTGDTAQVQDGKLRVTGRCKDIIIRGGINVSPLMIENAINEVEGVEEVAVVGVGHEFWGEIIVAYVSPTGESDASDLKAAIRSHCMGRLSPGEQPDETILVEEFPRATTGKIQKNVLRHRIASHQAREALTHA